MSIWDDRFLKLAAEVASWSKDPSTKCGAVIVDNMNRVVSVGFNGFPTGVLDDERLEIRGVKLDIVVHAEPNAIIFAQRNLNGCRIYTHPFMPCSRCAGLIIQSGISMVVAPYQDNERWNDSFTISTKMFAEAGVTLRVEGKSDSIET